MSQLVHPLEALRETARLAVPEGTWTFLQGGAGDEITTSTNPNRYADLRLLPRVGVDVSNVDTSTTILGTPLAFPVLLAPTALHKLFHPDGEYGTVEGAKQAGTIPVVSMESSVATPELGKTAGDFWHQLYIQRDKGLTLDLINMMADAGAKALVVTLDNAVPGLRYRQDSAMVSLPDGVGRANFESGGVPKLTGGYTNAATSWKDVEWLASNAPLPVLGKGILRGDDAKTGLSSGLQGVIVSNHGGRNLDTTAPTIDCVVPVSDAVAGAAPVLLDSGVRRGADVAKALALGADAVMIGRPYVWGLAADGSAGVVRVLELLRDELVNTMELCGAMTLRDLTPDLILDLGRRS